MSDFAYITAAVILFLAPLTLALVILLAVRSKRREREEKLARALLWQRLRSLDQKRRGVKPE